MLGTALGMPVDGVDGWPADGVEGAPVDGIGGIGDGEPPPLGDGIEGGVPPCWDWLWQPAVAQHATRRAVSSARMTALGRFIPSSLIGGR
jgi:hypothetical protein